LIAPREGTSRRRDPPFLSLLFFAFLLRDFVPSLNAARFFPLYPVASEAPWYESRWSRGSEEMVGERRWASPEWWGIGDDVVVATLSLESTRPIVAEDAAD